jgi:hypothetical protein
MKTCLKCNIPKDESEFYKRKDTVDGLHRYCNICCRAEKKKYYSDNKEERKDYHQKYREDNREYFREYCHEHYHNNKEQYREWERNRLKTDPLFRLKKSIGALLNGHLNKNKVTKSNRTIKYLGCSIVDYKQYLEAKFTSEMNWENYGSYWEIDHIKPIDSFDLSDPQQLNECFNYKNTQPLSKKENREKSNKILQYV